MPRKAQTWDDYDTAVTQVRWSQAAVAAHCSLFAARVADHHLARRR